MYINHIQFFIADISVVFILRNVCWHFRQLSGSLVATAVAVRKKEKKLVKSAIPVTPAVIVALCFGHHRSSAFFSTYRESSIKVDIACAVSLRLYILHPYWSSLGDPHALLRCILTHVHVHYISNRVQFEAGCVFRERIDKTPEFWLRREYRLGLILLPFFSSDRKFNASVRLNNLRSTAP